MEIRKVNIDNIDYIYDYDQCYSTNKDKSLNFILYPLDREYETIVLKESELIKISSEVIDFQDRCYNSEQEYNEIINNIIDDLIGDY